MDLIAIFFTWNFIILSLAIAAAVFVVRKIIEFVILDNPNMPGNRSSKFWTQLFLPTLPIFVGLMLGFVKSYPYPDGINSLSGRIAFGIVAGLLSTTVYRVLYGLLKDKVSIINQDNVGNINDK